MSVSILNNIHENLRKAAIANLSAQLNTESSKLNVETRKILNTSIHIVEKRLTKQYILDYYKNSIPMEQINRYAEEYYTALKLASTNYLDIMYRGGGAFIILAKGKIPSSTQVKALKDVVFGNSVTPEEWDTLVSTCIPANGFNAFKGTLARANNSLLLKNTDPTFEQFLGAIKDVGHAPESSNINFLMGSVITSIINSSDTSKNVLSGRMRTTGNFIESNEALIQTEFNKLMKGSRANNKDGLFKYFLSTQLSYIRQIDKNGIHAELKLDLDNANLESLKKDISRSIHSTVTSVTGQDSFSNQDIGRSIERIVSKYLYKFYEASASVMSKQLSTNMVGKGDIISLKGSKSLKELIQDSIIDTLAGKPIQVKKIKTASISKSAQKPNIPISPTTKKPKKVTTSTKEGRMPPLRNTQGKFTSLSSLQLLMQNMLHDTIQKNMERPNLRYQTGRFAKSVKVAALTRARDGVITAFLSYMRYPYATFESGGRQGYKGYYPSRLIIQSAREIAIKLTKERFHAVTVK